MFEVVYLAVEIDSKGMFNDFLVTNKVIARYQKLDKYKDLDYFDVFLIIPLAEKERIIRQFARYNAECLEIDWDGSGLEEGYNVNENYPKEI